MQERMNKKELIELIKTLKLNKNEYWILSSGALVIRGILQDAGDLDIAVTKKGLQELKTNYKLKEKGNNWYETQCCWSNRRHCRIQGMSAGQRLDQEA